MPKYFQPRHVLASPISSMAYQANWKCIGTFNLKYLILMADAILSITGVSNIKHALILSVHTYLPTSICIYKANLSGLEQSVYVFRRFHRIQNMLFYHLLINPPFQICKKESSNRADLSCDRRRRRLGSGGNGALKAWPSHVVIGPARRGRILSTVMQS
jgi:hypothetical protein